MAKDLVEYNGKKGVWRTVSGRHIFIAEGEDLRTAMKNSGKFKNTKLNNQIRETLETGKKVNDKALAKAGYKVERDYFRDVGDKYITISNTATGKEIMSNINSKYKRDNQINALSNDGVSYVKIKDTSRHAKKDIRDKFDYANYLDQKLYDKKGDTLGEKVAQYKEDKKYLDEMEYEAKRIDEARARTTDIKKQLKQEFERKRSIKTKAIAEKQQKKLNDLKKAVETEYALNFGDSSQNYADAKYVPFKEKEKAVLKHRKEEANDRARKNAIAREEQGNTMTTWDADTANENKIERLNINDGIRKKQLVNNIEDLVYTYDNGINDGVEEPFDSDNALVDYVYSQVFDQKSNGQGGTKYGSGISEDLKYLGKDYIVSEIKRIGHEAGVVKEKSKFPTPQEAIANVKKAQHEAWEQQKVWDKHVKDVKQRLANQSDAKILKQLETNNKATEYGDGYSSVDLQDGYKINKYKDGTIQISKPHPYDETEYSWARKTSNGYDVIENGKVVKKTKTIKETINAIKERDKNKKRTGGIW